MTTHRTPRAQRPETRSSPTRRRVLASSPTPAPPPVATTTSSPPSASRPTTRTSPSTSSPTRATTCPRAGSTASPTAPAATRSTWTKLKAWGVDKPEPENGPGTGSQHVVDWPAHGWHEFRDPNEEWELTMYRYNANVVRQVNQNIENARQAKAFEQWTTNWVHFVERNVGAWMHIEHILGLYVFAACNRSGPTNMHNTAMVDQQRAQDPLRAGPRALQPHPLRGDRGLRRRRPHRRVEQRRRVAGRPQGHRGAHRRSTTTGASRSSPPTSCSSR